MTKIVSRKHNIKDGKLWGIKIKTNKYTTRKVKYAEKQRRLEQY